MTEETAKTPEWMLLLENKKKRLHRLAHDIGAGAPCLSCGDSCPGLDLHFWRKLCRNCKCKKEEHDVKDDEGYEQFELLFANSGVGKKKRPGAFLNIKVPEVSVSTSSSTGSISSSSAATSAGNKKGVAFDWIPPDVPEEVAAEYMQQLPPSKLPISGSDGALYRRQQLESQIPLHDLDATKCHGLTADEIKGLQQYLENLKNNVVGQGRVTKLPVLYGEQRLKYSGPARHQSVTVAHASLTGESRPIRISTSQSAQCLKSLPSLPLPRPFAAQHLDKDDPNNFPPPPPDMLPSGGSNLGLKTPSAFLPSVQYNAQVVAGQQSHDLVHSSQLPVNQGQTSGVGEIIARDLLNPGVQTSAQVPGNYYGIITGKQDGSLRDGNMKHMIYASDGTFLAEQQAHDVAFSSQMPVGLVSQQSKILNAPKDGSNVIPGEGHFPKSTEETGDPSNPYARESIIAASQHPGTHPTANDGKLYGIHTPKDTLYSSSIPGEVPQYSNIQQGTNLPQDGTISALQHPSNMAYSSSLPGGVPQYSDVQRGTNLPQDGTISALHHPSNMAYSSTIPGGVPQYSDVQRGTNLPQDGTISTLQHPNNMAYSSSLPGGVPQYSNVHQGTHANLPQDGTISLLQHPADMAYSSSVPGQKTSVHSIPSYGSLNSGNGSSDPSGTVPSQDAKFVPYSTNISGQVVHSAAIAGDSMPKSAQVLHQSHLVQQEGWEPDAMDNELAGKLEQLVGLGEGSQLQEEYHLNCHKCNEVLLSGQVAVLAERAGKQAAWHPQCFVCCTCEELLVDLIYFYHKGDVYCGRHYAELLDIPRCFACDELIFVKEYTCAEGKAFHVKHFCCYECDVPLGGKQYIPKDNQPMCLQCFENKYGKSCHTCKKKIAAGDQRVGWKELSWHVSPSCFCCSQCLKSLLGGKFLVKNEQPFCSKECYQAAISLLNN